MIGFVRDLVVELIVDPQAAVELGERRAFRDPEARPIDSEAQEIDVLALDSRPLAAEIGGSLEVRHRVSVAVDVAHGDPVEATRLRDLIVLDLILRALDTREELVSRVDPGTGQAVTAIAFEVDYRPLGISDTNESGTVTFTVDTILDR